MAQTKQGTVRQAKLRHLIVPASLAILALATAGCGSSSVSSSPSTPTSQATASSKPPLASALAPLTDEQRAEEQAFDLWLAELIQPLTAVFAVNASSCPKEGDKVDISYSHSSDKIDACAQWTSQVTSTGKVNGVPLSGAAMVTANPPEMQRFATVSWSCSGTVYTTKWVQGVVVRSGANSSAGTIERSQIRISATSDAISDADRANGITWQGKVLINSIERLSYSAEDFSNVTPNYNPPTKPLGVGQWTSYTDIQSEAALALQSGKLVTSDHNQIVPSKSIFSVGYTSDSDFAQCVRSLAPWAG
jgi:hypothetical protein